MAASRPTSGASDKLVPKPCLSQYVFTDKLGSGTYATVYKAYRKTGIREVVAIKCVLKSSLNKASTENLLTEIELLKNLKHENIVTLRDFMWDNHYIYLIMEYCSGGDLSRFIKSKRALPEHVVKRFLQQIASAMKFLWDKNVAHMDLKPQNILLTSSSSPQVKLADFGFAKHLYDGASLHAMRGSPLYMAPEIICRRSYDNRVDLWSIGVILFECLFGKAPFASKSFRELGEKIWDEKPVEIPHGFCVSQKARDLTLRLLQRKPDDRITFEEFFAHPFVDMEHMPSSHSLPTAIQTVSRAVSKDNEGDTKAAIKLYCEALEYFMPAIHYEKNYQKKESLRAKVKAYMDRAESLKQQMKPQKSSHSHLNPLSYLSSSTPESKDFTNVDLKSKNFKGEGHVSLKDNIDQSDSASPLSTTSKVVHQNSETLSNSSEEKEPTTCTCPTAAVAAPGTHSNIHKPDLIARTLSNDIDELSNLCEDSPKLLAVTKLINAAVLEEQEENYEACLHHYEVALGAVLEILPNEPKGKRKKLLNDQVVRWMSKAEQIKAYLEVLAIAPPGGAPQLPTDDSLSQSRNCSIQ